MMKRPRLIGIVVLLTLPWAWTLLPGTTSAAQPRTLTVSKTTAADFTTIQAAIDAARPGDTVQITDSATYPEHLPISKNNLTLHAAMDQLPVITGRPGAPNDLDLIDVSGTDRVTIRGLKLMGGTDDGITASPGPRATNLTIEGCQFENLDDTGIIVNDGSTATIRNNTFSGLGTGTMRAGNGINILNGSTATITGNTFMNLLGTGVLASVATVTVMENTFMGGPMNGQFSDGIALVRSSAEIRGNRLMDLGRIGIGTFFPQNDPPPAQDSTINITGNLIEGSGTAVPQVGIGIQLVASNNTRNTFNVMQNTIRGVISDGILILAASTNIIANRILDSGRLGIGTFPQATNAPRRDSTVNIINNLIANSGIEDLNGSDGLQLVGTANTRYTFNLVNNTIADNTRGAILYALQAAGSSVRIFNTILSGSGANFDILFTREGTQRVGDLSLRNCLIDRDPLMVVGRNGNITGNPQFVAPLDGDYHLRPHSPAINAGDSTVAGLPATDLDGNPRIVGSAVDVGAYEFQP